MTINFAFWLSLVLAAMGCLGLYLAGRGSWHGWALGLAVQPLWATYAIVTEGYGLLLTCFMYGAVNLRNLLRWRNARPPKTSKAKCSTPCDIDCPNLCHESHLIVSRRDHHPNECFERTA